MIVAEVPSKKERKLISHGEEFQCAGDRQFCSLLFALLSGTAADSRVANLPKVQISLQGRSSLTEKTVVFLKWELGAKPDVLDGQVPLSDDFFHLGHLLKWDTKHSYYFLEQQATVR